MPNGSLRKHITRKVNKKTGVEYFYYRRKVRGKDIHIALPGKPGSAEFKLSYQQTHASFEVNRPAVLVGTVGELLARYKASDAFKRLEPHTQKYYMKHLDLFEPYAKANVLAAALREEDIFTLADHYEGRRGMRKKFFEVANALLNFGAKKGIIPKNPLSEIPEEYDPVQHKAWTDADCDKFEAAKPPQGVFVGYLVGRYTGQRLGDVVKMRWEDYDGKVITVDQSKPRKKIRVIVQVPVHERLRAVLDKLPRSSEYIAAMSNGSPWKWSTLSKRVTHWVRRAGLKDKLSFHGLRHHCGIKLALLGRSVPEIMAILGHQTPKMALHYVKQAEQIRLASNAMQAWNEEWRRSRVLVQS